MSNVFCMLLGIMPYFKAFLRANIPFLLRFGAFDATKASGDGESAGNCTLPMWLMPRLIVCFGAFADDFLSDKLWHFSIVVKRHLESSASLS